MKQSERGSNLVEFALVTFFILVPLLAGIADVGRAFNSYMVITNAAREGARAASRLSCYPADAAQRAVYKSRIEQIVRGEVAGSAVPPDSLSITIDPDPVDTGCAVGAEEIQVSVSYLYTTILSSVLGIGDFTMSSSTSMAKVGKTGE
jgi:Flp pilus assembly protein TadG